MWNTEHFIARHGALAYAKTVSEGFVASILGLPVSALGMGYYELVKPLVLRMGFTVVVALLGILGISAVGLLFAFLRRASLPPRPPVPSLLPLLVTVSAVHLLTLVALFPDQWMYAGLIWYFLVQYLCLFLFIGWIGGWLAGALSDVGWHRFTGASRVAAALAVIPMLLWRPALPTEGQIKRLAANWINEHLPPNAIVASHDAGALGYFSRVPVINLDGLVNNREYLDNYLRTGKKRQYLVDAGVTHLADVGRPRSANARFSSLLHIPKDGRIVLKLQGNEDDLDFCIVELAR
jgi:hypothetical protein